MSRVGRRTTARERRSRALTVAAAVLAGVVLAGCGDGGYEPRGPFRPLPEGAPPRVGPPSTEAVPPPSAPAEPGAEGEDPGDPNVVATDLQVPTGLVVLPDGSAVVGERETGTLWQVFPDRSPQRELMTVPGIDTAATASATGSGTRTCSGSSGPRSTVCSGTDSDPRSATHVP